MSVTIMINNARVSDPELNLANGNFQTLDAALGVFDGKWCGSVDPRRLLAALRAFDPDLAVRDERRERGAGGAELIYCGLRDEQVGRYVQTLTAIGQAAERRDELVVWG